MPFGNGYIVEEKEIGWMIPLIVIVGGFLFSIIWEAQGRYVLPYYVFAVLYAAYGVTESMGKVHRYVGKQIAQYKKA